MGYQEPNREFLGEKGVFTDEAPIHRPLVEKLPRELESTGKIAPRKLQEKWSCKKKLFHGQPIGGVQSKEPQPT
jgi:hypothetical protein